MAIYLSRPAYLDFSGSFVFVLGDGGMLAQLSSWSHVKVPNISDHAHSQKGGLKPSLGSRRILGNKSIYEPLFSPPFAAFKVCPF